MLCTQRLHCYLHQLQGYVPGVTAAWLPAGGRSGDGPAGPSGGGAPPEAVQIRCRGAERINGVGFVADVALLAAGPARMASLSGEAIVWQLYVLVTEVARALPCRMRTRGEGPPAGRQLRAALSVCVVFQLLLASDLKSKSACTEGQPDQDYAHLHLAM